MVQCNAVTGGACESKHAFCNLQAEQNHNCCLNFSLKSNPLLAVTDVILQSAQIWLEALYGQSDVIEFEKASHFLMQGDPNFVRRRAIMNSINQALEPYGRMYEMRTEMKQTLLTSFFSST